MAMFVNPLINPASREPQDLSRQTEDVYIQVEPFAYDKETGDVINSTNRPIRIKSGSVNVYEKIQSYLDSINSKLDSLAPEIKDNIFNDKELDSIIADVVKKELVARNLVKDDKEVK